MTQGRVMEKKFGIKRGIKDGKLETAKAMIKNNISIEIIEKCTGIDRKEFCKKVQTKVDVLYIMFMSDITKEGVV